MRWLAGLCLVATAALWAWALSSRAEVEPLPDRFVGEFVLYRFEPPMNRDGKPAYRSSPFKPGQERRYVFRPDGTWMMRVLVSGGYEMLRQEGTVRVEDRNRIVMTQLAENRSMSEPIDYRYAAEFMNGPEGEEIKLTAEVGEADRARLSRGLELYLRRLTTG